MPISMYDDVMDLWFCLVIHVMYVTLLRLFIIVTLSCHIISLIRLGITRFAKLYILAPTCFLV
jgi:hypothetical protein